MPFPSLSLRSVVCLSEQGWLLGAREGDFTSLAFECLTMLLINSPGRRLTDYRSGWAGLYFWKPLVKLALALQWSTIQNVRHWKYNVFTEKANYNTWTTTRKVQCIPGKSQNNTKSTTAAADRKTFVYLGVVCHFTDPFLDNKWINFLSTYYQVQKAMTTR